MEIATNCEAVKCTATRNQFVGSFIIAHLNFDAWLQQLSKVLWESNLSQAAPPHFPSLCSPKKYKSHACQRYMYPSERLNGLGRL